MIYVSNITLLLQYVKIIWKMLIFKRKCYNITVNFSKETEN